MESTFETEAANHCLPKSGTSRHLMETRACLAVGFMNSKPSVRKFVTRL
jgi:hypothetical protein